MMPEFLSIDQVLEQRRAQRHFHDKPLPEGAVDEIIRLALKTPSGFNLQPWHITIVDALEAKQALSKACWNQAQITEASATLVISGDTEAWRQGEAMYTDLGTRKVVPQEVAAGMTKMIEGFFDKADRNTLNLWVTRQCSLLGMTLMMVTEALGYNSCPVEGFVGPQVKQVLELPESHEVVLVLPIGYGTGEKQDFGRFPADRVTSRNRYEEPSR